MRNAKDLQGLAIVDVRGGNKLGRADEIVVSPEDGRLLGFVMKSMGMLSPNEKVVEMRDVRSIGPDAITVDGDQVVRAVEEADDAFQEARSGGRTLNGRKVVTQTGKVLGTVGDYTIDEEQARVSGLLLGGGMFEKVDMIPANRIVSVGADVVVVSDEGAPSDAAQPRPFVG